MTAEVVVEALEGEGDEDFAFVVPDAAVVTKAGQTPYVWLIEPENNTAVRRTVVVDEPDASGQRTVREGLEAGDIIATAGAKYLTEGMQVIPVTRIRF